MGQAQLEIVDDRLPINDWGDPINARPSPNGAWWLPILEKAYAKMNVNYANLNGGTPIQAFRELTNMPVASYEVQ